MSGATYLCIDNDKLIWKERGVLAVVEDTVERVELIHFALGCGWLVVSGRRFDFLAPFVAVFVTQVASPPISTRRHMANVVELTIEVSLAG